MRGARGVLASARPVVFYEWDPYSYGLAGEDDVSHAEFLMELGFERFLIFDNRGDFSSTFGGPDARSGRALHIFLVDGRRLTGWYYDIAAFTEEHQAVCESLWRHYSQSVKV